MSIEILVVDDNEDLRKIGKGFSALIGEELWVEDVTVTTESSTEGTKSIPLVVGNITYDCLLST